MFLIVLPAGFICDFDGEKSVLQSIIFMRKMNENRLTWKTHCILKEMNYAVLATGRAV